LSNAPFRCQQISSQQISTQGPRSTSPCIRPLKHGVIHWIFASFPLPLPVFPRVGQSPGPATQCCANLVATTAFPQGIALTQCAAVFLPRQRPMRRWGVPDMVLGGPTTRRPVSLTRFCTVCKVVAKCIITSHSTLPPKKRHREKGSP